MANPVEIDRARVPEGGELVLYAIGDGFEIRIDGRELMASGASASEERLARLGCKHLDDSAEPRVLIGGLGMGYTVRAALDVLPASASVTVVEVVQAVADWNRGPLADLAGRPLDDARVSVKVADVGAVLRTTTVRYDAILLDVDNGPEGLSRKANHALYTATGLATAKRALRRGGCYGVWAASRNRGFEQRVDRAGFDLEVSGGKHIVYLATPRTGVLKRSTR
jgi:spermidine synthase